jgi:hypothetical protein
MQGKQSFFASLWCFSQPAARPPRNEPAVETKQRTSYPNPQQQPSHLESPFSLCQESQEQDVMRPSSPGKFASSGSPRSLLLSFRSSCPSPIELPTSNVSIANHKARAGSISSTHCRPKIDHKTSTGVYSIDSSKALHRRAPAGCCTASICVQF